MIELSINCPRCDASVHVDSPRQTMVCGKCMSEFDFPDHLKCRGYGTVMAIREAPPWFRTAVPRAKLVAGGRTHSEDQPGTHLFQSPSGGAVALSCPKCAASLLIDGKERLVPCGYCNTRVYLPDDLWLRLHPANMKTRWFMGF